LRGNADGNQGTLFANMRFVTMLMRMRNFLCWLVYNFDLGRFGPWVLGTAFADLHLVRRERMATVRVNS
jgi:hypothetical protein